MRRLAPFALIMSVSLLAASARAQSPDPANAEILFREGRARMEAGDAAQACPKFAESLRLDFAPGTLLNLAACEEQLGQLASAWSHYVDLTSQLPSNDDRRPFVLDRVAKLEKRVPRLAVAFVHAPSGAFVTRDGVAMSPETLGEPVAVNPGEHRIVVVAPGHVEARYVLTMREGEQRSLIVAPGAVTADEIARRNRMEARRTAGWIIGGVGVASIAAGGYFGVRALTEQSRSDAICSATTCRDATGLKAYDDARSDSRIADITLGAGVIAVGVATYLVLTSREPTEGPAPPPRAAIRMTPFGIAGTW